MLANLFTLLFYLLRIIVLVFSTGLVCVLVHEMGHAIPILFFSKNKVEVYIGSVGTIEKSHRFPIGRLIIFISHNPFHWYKGMCKPMGQHSINQQLFYVCMGPLASVGLAIAAYNLLAATEGNSTGRWMSGGVLLFSTWVSFITIIPIKLKQARGELKGNDGWIIIQLLKNKKNPPPVYDLGALVQQGKLKEAVHIFETRLDSKANTAAIDRLGVWLYIQQKDYKRASAYDTALALKTTYSVIDFINGGFLKCMNGDQVDAIEMYKKALAIDPLSLWAWTNISYSNLLLEQYDDAIENANRALAIDPAFAGALDNRGLARLRIGLLEEGKSDIEAALAADDKQPEIYRNLGIYFILKKRWVDALVQLEKAKTMDADTADIDLYIAEATKNIETATGKAGN